jgi:hypothetical protein
VAVVTCAGLVLALPAAHTIYPPWRLVNKKQKRAVLSVLMVFLSGLKKNQNEQSFGGKYRGKSF